MKIAEIKYMRRVNLGNYEHEEITATAVISEGEDANKEGMALKNQVLALLNLSPEDGPKKEEEKKEETKEEAAPAKKTRKAAPAKEEEKKEEAKEETRGEKPAKRTRKAASSAKKNTPYDRENKAHKVQFATIAEENFAGWKKDPELAKKVKAASVELNGSDMLDDSGTVMDAFTDQMIKIIEGGDDL